jgi:transporter family protein
MVSLIEKIDWRLLILVYIFITGVWGVLVKIASMHLNPFTATFTALTSAWITVAIFSFSKLDFHAHIGVLVAAGCGALGSFSTILFYGALKQAPANVVIPLSTLYISITVVLSFLFLGEGITPKQLGGIILGFIAIVLLTS